MEIPGGGGSNMKPSATENPVRTGVKLEKTLRGEGGGVWIFSGTTRFKVMSFYMYMYMYTQSKVQTVYLFNTKNGCR